MDRLKAAIGTARGLAGRLDRSGGASGRHSKELIAGLASQLYLVGQGIEDVLMDAPVEVVLAVQPVLQERPISRVPPEEWCGRLLWRTGRVQLVFDGNFDLIGEAWPAAGSA